MILKANHTETDFLLKAHQMLIQARTQTEIALKLAEFGYTPEKIDEGLQMSHDAHVLLKQFEIIKPAKKHWVKEYQRTKSELEKLYTQHRYKAKLIFRKSPDVLSVLGLTGTVPINFADWFMLIRSFYAGVLANPVLQLRLQKYQVPLSEIKKGNQLLKFLEVLHKKYLNEEDIPEPLIFERDELLVTLDHWLDDFLIAAEFAFEKSPKLKRLLGMSKFLLP